MSSFFFFFAIAFLFSIFVFNIAEFKKKKMLYLNERAIGRQTKVSNCVVINSLKSTNPIATPYLTHI